jgi:hypothetical protein
VERKLRGTIKEERRSERGSGNFKRKTRGTMRRVVKNKKGWRERETGK